MKYVKLFLISGLLLTQLLAGPVVTAQVTLPHTFGNGDPADGDQVMANFTALESAVNTNNNNIATLENTVANNSDFFTSVFAGDGSAGNLVVDASQSWTAVPPANPNFADVDIEAGQTLTVPAGTTIRCHGSFVNNGTIVVDPGARSNSKGLKIQDVTAKTLSFPHPGDSFGAATPPDYHNNGLTDNVQADGGLGGVAIPRMTTISSFRNFKFGGGSGSGYSGVGAGGGLLRIYCSGDIINNGIIMAAGENAFSQLGVGSGGGGGGGIVVLASRVMIDNDLGTITANGGDGADGTEYGGSGGGGGGGIVMFIAPNVNQGAVDVSGGAGGVGNSDPGSNVRTGGGAGGACGGNGGSGGARNSSAAFNGAGGGTGYQVMLSVDPMSLLF